MKYHLFILFISLSLVSCAITKQKNHYTGTRHNNKGAVRYVVSFNNHQNYSGFIYGNIQTYSGLKNVEINKLVNGKVDSNSNIKVRTFSNGNFVVENLEPGNYIISSIKTGNKSLDIFNMENEVEFFSIKVLENKVVYAGTYKILTSEINATEIKAKVLRSAVPTEKKILKHVSILEKNSKWAKSINARMQELI
ncbi:MAG: hypothetical protein ACC657_10235 [Thiohalomonadales bacterium]